MFQIKFDEGRGFPNDMRIATKLACVTLEGLSTIAAGAPPAGLMVEWFGSSSDPDLFQNLRMMNNVISDSKRTVTFVDARGIDLKVAYNPQDISASPSPAAPSGTPGQFYGFAFPVNMGSMHTTRFHVGSGMRIYLGDGYFYTGNQRERVQTIYHELSHKVLGTNDHMYEADPCRDLAKNRPDLAKRNADSYGFFATSLDGFVW
jgi:hypothetical protein